MSVLVRVGVIGMSWWLTSGLKAEDLPLEPGSFTKPE